tara:strand:+ start:234 stop:440 length:207 start_codon:yes stop_codon:yes gene_type:complete
MAEKGKNMNINWINGFKATNKKEKYEINIRIGTMTVLEIMFCPCEVCENKKNSCARFRFMIFNLGLEL